MIGWRFEFGTLSDLSATIFSVFLLLLVLLIDTSIGQPPSGGDAPAIERSPLDAAAMADLLYQRRAEAAGTRIDVTPGRITLVTPSGTETFAPQALNGPLRAGRIADPINLYVFDNASYAPVIAALTGYGRTWREISVPAALRQPAGGEGGWTADFSALLARSQSREAFMRDLTVILGGGAQQSHNNLRGLRDDPGTRRQGGYGAAAGYIASMWTSIPADAILSILWAVSGIGIIALIERRARRRA